MIDAEFALELDAAWDRVILAEGTDVPDDFVIAFIGETVSHDGGTVDARNGRPLPTRGMTPRAKGIALWAREVDALRAEIMAQNVVHAFANLTNNI